MKSFRTRKWVVAHNFLAIFFHVKVHLFNVRSEIESKARNAKRESSRMISSHGWLTNSSEVLQSPNLIPG